MKNLTLIFLTLVTLANLLTGFGLNVHKRTQNIAIENQNSLFNALKGDISFEPIKSLFAQKKAQRRDITSGFGKSKKDNFSSQKISAFAIFYSAIFENNFVISANKIAPNLSIFKSEFSNTSFLI